MPADTAAAPLLVAPVRTPMGKPGGRSARPTATDLGTEAAAARLEREAV